MYTHINTTNIVQCIKNTAEYHYKPTGTESTSHTYKHIYTTQHNTLQYIPTIQQDTIDITVFRGYE